MNALITVSRWLIFLILFTSNPVLAQSSLLQILTEELEREFEILKKEEIPPYYMEYRVSDVRSFSISATFGSLTGSDETRNRILLNSVRVGDYGFDNTHPSDHGSGFPGDFPVQITSLPLEDNEAAIRQKIWRITDMNYKSSVSTYQSLISSRSKKDSIPDFTREKAHQHEDPPMDDKLNNFDRKIWEQKLKEFSNVFLRDNVFAGGDANLEYILERKYFVSTEGSRIAQNHCRARLVLSATILAEDGNMIPLERVYYAESPAGFPSSDSIILACQEIVKDLRKLSDAPKAEPYTGPAILSESASGVFFHEIFGHRIEGHRLKEKSDGQTFKARIGEKVLNKSLTVYSDPTINDHKGEYLAGYYSFDEQGIPGQKVTVVEDGILKNFLLSRQPLDRNSKSNGHGRAGSLFQPVSRQSNLFIEAENTKTEEQLRKILKRECRKLGLEYGYYIERVSGGFTTTSRYQPNVFNIQPREVYRVYTDGRPDELVRGVTLIGTPLVMFSGIVAAGDREGVFTGICGAESGGVPVSTVAPALLVSRIETQKEPEGEHIKPILPLPGGIRSPEKYHPDDSIIMRALTDELRYNLDNLKYKDFDKPFFISYAFSKHREYTGTATLGSIESSSVKDYSSNYVRVLVGDYDLNDENFQDYSAGNSFSSGYIPTPLDHDYWGIRRSFWKITDEVYKSAGSIYKNKVETLNTMKLPDGFEPIPDFSREEPTRTVIQRPGTSMDTTGLDELLRIYSSIMLEYKDLISSNVTLKICQSDHFFINSEGTRVQYPTDHTTLMINVESFSKDFQPLSSSLAYDAVYPSALPLEKVVEADIRAMIDSILVLRGSPMENVSYYGPVLFCGSAARDILSSMVLSSMQLFTANRPVLIKDHHMNLYYTNGFNRNNHSLKQRVISDKINITARNHMTRYTGVELTGNYEVDAEGVIPPSNLSLVENGVLVNQLNGRTPSRDIRQSTGHMRSSPFFGKVVAPGILDIEVTDGGTTFHALKEQLITKARNENLEHAYILRKMSGQGRPMPLLLYQVDPETGAEQLVRMLTILELPEKSLRRITGLSSERVVHNTYYLGRAHSPEEITGMANFSFMGLPVSFIMPNAFIVDDVNLNPIVSPISISPPVVPSFMETGN